MNSELILNKAVVKVFSNNGLSTQWKYSGLWGLLCLIVDKHLKTVLLRLLDITLSQTLLELELYLDFCYTYTELSAWFHWFPVPGGQLGISFTAKEDAASLKTDILKYSTCQVAYNDSPMTRFADYDAILQTIGTYITKTDHGVITDPLRKILEEIPSPEPESDEEIYTPDETNAPIQRKRRRGISAGGTSSRTVVKPRSLSVLSTKSQKPDLMAFLKQQMVIRESELSKGKGAAIASSSDSDY